MSWLGLSFLPRPHPLASPTSPQTDLICPEPRGVKGPPQRATKGITEKA